MSLRKQLVRFLFCTFRPGQSKFSGGEWTKNFFPIFSEVSQNPKKLRKLRCCPQKIEGGGDCTPPPPAEVCLFWDRFQQNDASENREADSEEADI